MYVENFTGIQMTLPAGGVEGTPVVANLPTFGSTLLTAWLYTAAVGTIFVKITDREKNMIPVTGFMLVPPGTAVPINIERQIEGPPWVLEIWAFNTGGAPAQLSIGIKSGDIREVDTGIKTLQELQRIRELLERQILGVVTKKMEV